MPYFSDELVEEVRSRNDIVDLIGGYVRLQKRGNNYFGLCPFHSEKSPSFSVSRDKQMYYCFGCGAGGTAFNFLMQYENLTFFEAMEILADRAGIELPKQEMTSEQKREADARARLFEINKEAAKYYYFLLRSQRGERAMEYFKKRELKEETINKFGLGFSDQYSDALYKYLRQKGYTDAELRDSGLFHFDERYGAGDRFRNRAMFPIMDVRSHVIGFGGRVMGEGEPKYLNSPETKIFDKGRNLYGLNLAKTSRLKGILLCEGYMDVIALHQAGFDNAVASLGTALTSGHANLLHRYTDDVYITYDSDGAGVKAALRAIPILKEAGIRAKVIDMRPYKDPDEFIKALGADEYRARIEKAENSFLYEIRMAERDFDMGDPESKSAFYREIAARLLGFTEELERKSYIEAVAERYRISPEDLKKLVNSLAIKGEQIKRPRELKSGIREKKEREDGIARSQKLFLTWLIEDITLFEDTKGLVSADDFTEEPYHKVAEMLYQQYESEHVVNPARIINSFTEPGAQNEAASLFHARLSGEDGGEERRKALKETIVRIKQHAIDFRMQHSDPEDVEALMRAIEDRKALEVLKNKELT